MADAIGLRSARIDTMRGVSIVLVLLHHFNIAYSLRDTAIAQFVGWEALHAVVRNGNYAVTIFFAISGFLITENADRRWGGLSNINLATFYLYRAARILSSGQNLTKESLAVREARAGSSSFLKKKNQKTFVIMACVAGENRDSDTKVFCFFSSEKKKSSSAMGAICLVLTTSIHQGVMQATPLSCVLALSA